MSNTAQTHPVQGLEYVVLGVATCFQRDEDGHLREVLVAEPLPAAALDCLAQEGRSTSYCLLYATTYAEIVNNGTPTLPADVFPAGVVLGEDFVERLQAAARTYRSKPQFRHIPLHQVCTPERGAFKLNHSLEPRRILNTAMEVKDADNIKQHPHTHQQL
ncbi:hypothetical protein NW851_04680 [Synechococcus sp. H55.7]|uniref:hypothetical protein n=1 Tax=unclassified Synechococcus TaxID=2626047 RepID=UPI0039C32496